MIKIWWFAKFSFFLNNKQLKRNGYRFSARIGKIAISLKKSFGRKK